jgi:hypothetical protein
MTISDALSSERSRDVREAKVLAQSKDSSSARSSGGAARSFNHSTRFCSLIPTLELPSPHPRSLPSPPHYRARHSRAKRLHSNCEATLHHDANQRRHEVYLHALCPPGQHSRLRPARRQPPHPGRYRHQSARHHRSPRAGHVFVPRRPTAHLADLTSGAYPSFKLYRPEN